MPDDPLPDGGNLAIKLVILFILILVNAFFAMSEIAIISLNDNKIRRMAGEGHKKAAKIIKLTADSSTFLSTIQIGVTLAGFLTSASAAENFSGPLAKTLAGWFGVDATGPISLISGISTILVTIIMAYFSLVLGELAPKRIAMQKSEAISFKVVGILLGVKTVTRPFVWLLSVSTNGIVRLLGFDPHASEENVTEEEIRMLVDVGEEKGVIEESQKDMINNIFDFDDITAEDVMTHRTDIEAVDIEDSIEDVLTIAINEGYSRIPVFHEDLDDVKGILYIKDLLPFVGQPVPKKQISDLMRPAHFVPATKRCGSLFAEMTEKHIQMVIVSDEYGGTAGMVTIEDLMESIFGNMQDEYDNEDDEIKQLDDSTFTIDGTADIEEVEELLGLHLPSGEYDTVGGMIMAELGYIPAAGDTPSVEAAGYLFTVESMDDRRIEKVRVEKIPEPESDTESADDKNGKNSKKS